MKKILPIFILAAFSSGYAADYTWTTGSTGPDPRDPEATVPCYESGADISQLYWGDVTNWNVGDVGAEEVPSENDSATILFYAKDDAPATILLDSGETIIKDLTITNAYEAKLGNRYINIRNETNDTTLNVTGKLTLSGAISISGTSNTNGLNLIANEVDLLITKSYTNNTWETALPALGYWGKKTFIDINTLSISGIAYNTVKITSLAEGSKIKNLNIDTAGTNTSFIEKTNLSVENYIINVGETTTQISANSKINIDKLVLTLDSSTLCVNATTVAGALNIGSIEAAGKNSSLGIVNNSIVTLTGTGNFIGKIYGQWNKAATGKIIIANGANQIFSGDTNFSYAKGSEDGTGYGTKGVDVTYAIEKGGKLTLSYANAANNTNNLVKIENAGTLVAGVASVDMASLTLSDGSSLEIDTSNIIDGSAFFNIAGDLLFLDEDASVNLIVNGEITNDFIVFKSSNASEVDLDQFILSNGSLYYDEASNSIMCKAAVPEPSTVAMIFAMLALGYVIRRKK